jgi:nucleoid-associated protein YgaU
MSTATIHLPQQRRTVRPTSRGAADRRPTAVESEALGYVRITRRGRVVLVVATLALAFGGFTLVSGPAESTKAAHHAAAEQVVVEPGQTLWDIAQSIAPTEATRTVIAEIVDLNSLGSEGDIRAGQPLYVPEY